MASAQRPRGTFGIDAPWVPCMWLGYAVVYGALAFLSATVWRTGPGLVAVTGLASVGSAAGAGLYWHSSLRGKVVIWDETLRTAPTPRRGALDIGCGRGMVAIMVAVRHPDVPVVGIDLWRSVDQSGNSPAAARRNAADNGVADQIRFVTGDMTRLPYPDASFDLVTASLSIHNVRSREGRRTAIGEAVRVLAPGGTILIVDIRRTPEYVDDLHAAGLATTTRPAGWRGWWSGPWMRTTIVRAAAPTVAAPR